MSVTTGLEPAKVFEYFEKICSIPHGSNNERALSDFCVEFAKEHGLKYYQDELYNVIIVKEAFAGYEDRPTVIIQGHLDMVCEKENSSTIDFEKDGLKLLITDGYLHADRTTLGGDDGIAIAYALALLDSQNIEHPRLEVVFTVCEELGMEGASGIDLSMLSGKILLNLDSEEEGVILTSCAGGCHVTCRLPMQLSQNARPSAQMLQIDITGLTGGHSGCEIHQGRANANVLAGRLLSFMGEKGIDFGICGICGGKKDNAIPVSSTVTISVCDMESAKKAIDEFAENICREYKKSDPDMNITYISANGASAIKEISAKKPLINLIAQLPNGVIAMSSDIAEMVETSLNFGIIDMEENCLVLHYLLRSSKEEALDKLVSQMKKTADTFSANITVSSRYPAWEYKKDSGLRKTMSEVYKKLYGREPEFTSIHAGVECGLLASKIQGLDCVSFGPDILDIHTTRERMSIASVQRTWEYLLEILKSIR